MASGAVVQRVARRVVGIVDDPLAMRLPDGRDVGPSDAPFRLVLPHPWSLRAMLLPATDLQAGEAYVYGDIDVEGDLVAALHWVAALRARGWDARLRAALLRDLLRLPRPPRREHDRRARLRGRPHSTARDRAAIRFHYDLGNDFFALFLDRRLVYSCAYYAHDEDSLDSAQERKLDLVCRKLRLRTGVRLLDVGCGWGGLVIHAAQRYGVEAVGCTLSHDQAELARERVRRAGLAQRVRILEADYRELDGRFDAVASVGMFEHVGPQQLQAYFRRMHELVAPGGLFLNHGITTGILGTVRDHSRRPNTFSARYVFPDGGLVPAWTAVRHLEEAGFEAIDLEQLRPHYGRTLRAWVRRLEAAHGEAVRLAGETDYRIWRAYMAASAVGFERGELGVVQVLGSKGASLPLGRRWMGVPAAAPVTAPAEGGGPGPASGDGALAGSGATGRSAPVRGDPARAGPC